MLKFSTISKQIKEQKLLWFSASNSYVIVDNNINELINLFVSNSKKSSFISAASETTGVSHSQSEFFYDEINQLFSANSFEEKSTPPIVFIVSSCKHYVSILVIDRDSVSRILLYVYNLPSIF